MQTLAVVIVSWNVRELLDRCLIHLARDLERTQAISQTWVVDNDSRDGTVEMVRARHPWVNLETPGENLGYVRGNNLVLKRLLKGESVPPDLIWLLNPDTEVQPGATQALLDLFATHPRAGLAGPKLLNADGSLQPGAFRFPGLLQPLFDLEFLPRRFYDSRWNGRYAAYDYAKSNPFRIDHPLGAAMMARATTVAEIGPLDANFFMYCEEIDWAWRMRRAGWERWLVPEAEVIHHGGASTRQARPQTTAHLWTSRAHLYHKHHGPLTRLLVAAFVRRYFQGQQPESPEWGVAHRQIIEAWERV